MRSTFDRRYLNETRPFVQESQTGSRHLVFRWQQHLFAGVDYDGDMVNEKQLSSDLKLYRDQINKIKESMGLSKKAREDAAADGNFSAWLSDLKARAKLFGIHREQQLTKALVLMKELFTIVNAYDRSDAEERSKLGFERDASAAFAEPVRSGGAHLQHR